EQLLLTRELHAHATNPDDVDLRFQRDRLDVLVYDLDFPVRRAQRRQRGQAQRRVHGPLVRQNLSKRPLGAPEALRKSRVDQQQAHVNRPFGLRRVVRQGTGMPPKFYLTSLSRGVGGGRHPPMWPSRPPSTPACCSQSVRASNRSGVTDGGLERRTT